MISYLKLWNTRNSISVNNCEEIAEIIVKISNIKNTIYLLTENHYLYYGEVDSIGAVTLRRYENLELLDIDTSGDYLYTVDIHGKVHKRISSLDIVNEIAPFEDTKTCCHGCTGTKRKTKIIKLSVNRFGCLFISDTGQLWGLGFMPQIKIDGPTPKKVIFFDGRYVHNASVGHDFAVAVVSKQNDTIEEEENVFLPNCSRCMLSSPNSQNSFSDSCPLGLKFHNSYDIETTSTSSKNGSTFSMEDLRKCSSENCISENGEMNSKIEKNIIFRNTEAAKQFLTSKISWMSSAGEEYLVECTEKPTRIFKENVTSMASLVYEGVKSVGDKVATLSRHVSGSSDCNGASEESEPVFVHHTASDEFVWSLSQCTSEHDLSELGLQDKMNILLKMGSNLLNSEVWTWGNIVHGQLGLGDSTKRERPMIITKLLNVGVCKLSVESYHASVLTLDGRAFIWGRNDHNQVTLDSIIDQSSPRLFVHASSDERTADVVCGCYNTVILSSKSDLSYIGINMESLAHLYSKENFNDLRNVRELNIPLFNNLISCDNYTLLNISRKVDDTFLEYVSGEQKVLEEMLIIQSNLIKILMKKCATSQDSSLYEDFCRNFTNLLYITAVNAKSLLEFKNNLISECDIVLFKCVDEHISIYKSYLNILNNVISVDGFKYISKTIELPQCLSKLCPDITKKDKNHDEQIVSTLLLHPFKRLLFYTDFINYFHYYTEYKQKFKEIGLKWYNFKEEQEHKFSEAMQTQDFWLTSGKSIDFLKTPNKRLIRESNKYPISMLNAGRFSSHWFVLVNDVFVHVWGSNPSVHSLTTIWVELKEEICQICLKMPEENLVLCTNEPEERIDWFHVLQNTIKVALNKHDSLQPPLIRSASYVFTKHALYKDAKYSGRWNNSKMHGPGKMVWNNGRIYTGEFCFNQMAGIGRLEIPNVGVYDGEFKDNQQNGFGVLNYFNDDVYKGHFKDGLPHGHGSFRKGNFKSSTASVYIGEWQAGSKNGYGMMDDIITGEKYLGNWSDNKKQGPGLIVTSDGIYYEGTFHQDTLTGSGLMILEDGTYYEGDFRGVGLLNGKGKLTLKSGHTIEGNLSGSWNEGIKISNGIFTKRSSMEENKPKYYETLCAQVDSKWKGLFQYCYQILGVSDQKSKDTHRIWQNVAVYLSNSHQNTLKKCKGDKNLENSLNNLDTIPPYGREKLDFKSMQELKQYLTKAFQSPLHPLGILLNDLCVAYTSTYGGMVAHPLLLTHAVSELHSVVRRLYEIVRLLFPALPPYGKDHLIENKEREEIVSYQSLLYPIILPRIYSALFILYTLNNKHQELLYSKRLLEWNKHPDYTLLSFLSVNAKFLTIEVDAKDKMFAEAVETLQQLKTTFSPTEKLLVIKETMEKMTPVAKELLGENYIWNMDDLFPLFLYVVVRARVLQLGSELDFIENFMEPSLENGELGIMFTTLKACYQQILQEKTSIS